MIVDKYLMKRCSEIGRARNPQRPGQGLKSYLREVEDTMRYSQIERDPREIAKYEMREGKYLYRIGRTAYKSGIYGLGLTVAGIGMELIKNKYHISELDKVGDFILINGKLALISGAVTFAVCIACILGRRNINGIPFMDDARKVAKKNKEIVNGNLECVAEGFSL